MKSNTIIIAVILLAAGLGGGFFAGMQYQKGQTTQRGQFGQGANGTRRFGGGNSNGANRPISGEIISFDDKSITIKMQDGSSKIVLISDTAQINKADKATKADLKNGEKVAVFGMTNSDGSVSALSIQLNPQMRGFGGNQSSPSSLPR